MSADPTAQKTVTVQQSGGKIVWSIANYADGSNGKLVSRTDQRDDTHPRDKQMLLIGNRYLPGDGKNVISIEDDGSLGLWLVSESGEASHIAMQDIGYI